MIVLGIDLGTSSVKVLAVDRTGRVIASASKAYETAHPEPGAAEQNPETWWTATAKAIRELRLAGQQIDAIGLSGQMHGTVVLDRGYKLIGPAVIWSDTRSAEVLRAINERVGVGVIADEIGSPLATGFQAITCAWLRESKPDLWARMQTVLLPKDYLRFRLTGELAAEPSDGASSGFLAVRTREWSTAMLGWTGVEASQLPPVVTSASVAGYLTADAAAALGLQAGIPVVAGGGDAPLAALAAGVATTGSVLATLSSGAQITRFSGVPSVDPLARTHTFTSPMQPERGEPGWYVMGATMVAGSALHWLRSNVLRSQMSIEDLVVEAESVPPGAGGLVFSPYLAGERTPHMDPLARGAFLGLTADHDARHLTRAVIEGAVFGLQDALDIVLERTGPATSIVLAGGGAKSRLWRQTVADVFGLPVIPSDVADLSAMGAAVLAVAGLEDAKARDVAEEWASFAEPVLPDVVAHARFEQLRPVFRSLYQAHKDQFDLLHSVSQAIA